MSARTTQKLPIAALAGALLLAGCGVKGPLEPPGGGETKAAPNPLNVTVSSDAPGSTVTSTQTQTATSRGFIASPVGKDDTAKKKRIYQGKVPVTSRPERPDRGFILDDLL